MSYYIYFIYKYKAIISFNTIISKIEYIKQIKNFYTYTNKKDFKV